MKKRRRRRKEYVHKTCCPSDSFSICLSGLERCLPSECQMCTLPTEIHPNVFSIFMCLCARFAIKKRKKFNSNLLIFSAFYVFVSFFLCPFHSRGTSLLIQSHFSLNIEPTLTYCHFSGHSITSTVDNRTFLIISIIAGDAKGKRKEYRRRNETERSTQIKCHNKKSHTE